MLSTYLHVKKKWRVYRNNQRYYKNFKITKNQSLQNWPLVPDPQFVIATLHPIDHVRFQTQRSCCLDLNRFTRRNQRTLATFLRPLANMSTWTCYNFPSFSFASRIVDPLFDASGISSPAMASKFAAMKSSVSVSGLWEEVERLLLVQKR